MSKEDIQVNSYSNAFNVKRYFTPFYLLPAIWAVMVLRVSLKAVRNPSLSGKFIQKIRAGYNKQYRSPLSSRKFFELIGVFGARIVL
jgi:hypothetical protein